MLNELRNVVKNEKQDKTIVDIILYGSVARRKDRPNDVDIVVLFRNGTLKEQLQKVQEIKKKLTIQNLDIKPMRVEEFFDPSIFSRSGIIAEGISLLDGKPLAEKMGFDAFTIFSFTHTGKSHKEKVMFNNVLRGRSTEGIIKQLHGVHLAPGIIQVPVIHALEFEEVLNRHHVVYTKKDLGWGILDSHLLNSD